MRLEPRAQAAQDLQALLGRWLCNTHGLKAPLERRVLFNILAVLLKRRRADDLQLAAPERGLRMFAASIAPSAEPAPTIVCSSSMKRMTLPERCTSAGRI